MCSFEDIVSHFFKDTILSLTDELSEVLSPATQNLRSSTGLRCHGLCAILYTLCFISHQIVLVTAEFFQETKLFRKTEQRWEGLTWLFDGRPCFLVLICHAVIFRWTKLLMEGGSLFYKLLQGNIAHSTRRGPHNLSENSCVGGLRL